MGKLRVAVLMGGRSCEYEVSLATGREVVKHLDRKKYQPLPIIVSHDGQKSKKLTLKEFASGAGVGEEENGQQALVDILKDLKRRRVDVVFIAMHGPFGEDGTIQGMLEFLDFPYTGSGVLASALGMNKIAFRKLIKQEGVPCPRYLVFTKGDQEEKVWQIFGKPPVFVKPANQGSSVGASIVRKKSQLKKALSLAFRFGQSASSGFPNSILVEEYLGGMEVSCGVLGNQEPFALPVAEIVPKNDFFDYEAKYTPGKAEEIIPARISPLLTKKIQEISIKVFRAIGARGFARVDMILRGRVPVVLEINTIPGLTAVSILPKEARAAGISYSALLDRILELALERC